MDFVEENPMTYAEDWSCRYVPGNGWCISEFPKGLYDPCPVGYRVPDGGEDGFWATATDAPSNAWNTNAWNDSIMQWENGGFTWTLADGATKAWYPAVGYYHIGWKLVNVGYDGFYLSASLNPNNGDNVYYLNFYQGHLNPADDYQLLVYSVRCVKEK